MSLQRTTEIDLMKKLSRNKFKQRDSFEALKAVGHSKTKQLKINIRFC